MRVNLSGASLLGYCVNDPERYGVVEFDKQGQVIGIEEKPKEPKSNIALTGLYFYTNDIIEIAKQVKPSRRCELEITDVNNAYLQQGRFNVEVLNRGFAWLDTGTHASLLEAGEYVALLEKRQGLRIMCPEEIAWRMGYISDAQLEALANSSIKSGYGKYFCSSCRMFITNNQF